MILSRPVDLGIEISATVLYVLGPLRLEPRERTAASTTTYFDFSHCRISRITRSP